MRSLLVVDIVGLTPAQVGADTPALAELAASGFRAELGAVLPAVTCSAQATMLTGTLPSAHGIVGNGWYFRDLAEVRFWRQSNHLVAGPKVLDRVRERASDLRIAKLFWWFNMYSSADLSVTPRPAYFADGRKESGIYTEPPELGPALEQELGAFPLFRFWGPGAGLASSEWIAAASASVLRRERPHLALVYLPHLDYDHQRWGPRDPRSIAALRAIDRVAGGLFTTARELGMEILVVSEYGITEARGSVSPNTILRREGLLRVHAARNGELLDAGASRAFAVVDHQIAHVYVRDAADLGAVRRLFEGLDGVDEVLDRDAQRAQGLDHPRSGELVLVAAADKWFDYYYWLDAARAPDFARTVDIHSKPGYDPLELFLDPAKPLIRARIAAKLAAKKLGMRTLMDVIPLDPSLVGGTHGRLPSSGEHGPLLISSSRAQKASRFAMTDIADLILDTVFS